MTRSPLLEVLYLDEYIIAVNKPSGLLSIPDGYDPDLPNLSTILKGEYPQLFTLHRLDKDTSGIILFALNAESHKEFSLLFEYRTIKKTYRALVHASNVNSHFVIDQPLRVNGDRRHRTVINIPNGKPAQTEIHLIKQLENTAILDAFPRTGYTHQIRAHLAHFGMPIVNDPLYCPKLLDNTKFSSKKRLMLHARKISFLHPFSHQMMEINAPFPPELSVLIP